MSTVAWIAADWGTSNLRLWALDAKGAVVARRMSDQGMGQLAPGDFEGVLLKLAGDLIPPDECDVLICGMAGARQGWREANYAPVPCVPVSAALTRAPTTSANLNVFIVPGLSQTAPADVMRGEETQIAGFLSRVPQFSGSICLPGTHTKWVRVSGGRVTQFQTFMTGELFALLSDHSILRHTLGNTGWDDAAFQESAKQVMRSPLLFAQSLFQLRAGALLEGAAAGHEGAKLSGLLIGAELSAAQAFWKDQEVVLIGEAKVSRLYSAVLADLPVQTRLEPAGEVTLAGLKAIRENHVERWRE
jgi:2-dehydro-3-deoxygalactonokinase